MSDPAASEAVTPTGEGGAGDETEPSGGEGEQGRRSGLIVGRFCPPHLGHSFGWGGGCDGMLESFVELGTTKGLDATSCIDEVVVPPFELGD